MKNLKAKVNIRAVHPGLCAKLFRCRRALLGPSNVDGAIARIRRDMVRWIDVKD
jgi:hypothetical protein